MRVSVLLLVVVLGVLLPNMGEAATVGSTVDTTDETTTTTVAPVSDTTTVVAPGGNETETSDPGSTATPSTPSTTPDNGASTVAATMLPAAISLLVAKYLL
eukprot:GHVN01033729.1.p2 GENE.GHVN01033729.1~~GHVN01033729.1.p2  ORF type:complete len:101 (+),score=4.88 GHVN01033729.1:76-378(+)